MEVLPAVLQSVSEKALKSLGSLLIDCCLRMHRGVLVMHYPA